MDNRNKANEQDLSSEVLANLFTTYEMPDTGLPERTEATRRIGGFVMLEHLIAGDWDEVPTEMAIEIVARIAANATRQGLRADEITARIIANQHATPVQQASAYDSRVSAAFARNGAVTK